MLTHSWILHCFAGRISQFNKLGALLIYMAGLRHRQHKIIFRCIQENRSSYTLLTSWRETVCVFLSGLKHCNFCFFENRKAPLAFLHFRCTWINSISVWIQSYMMWCPMPAPLDRSPSPVQSFGGGIKHWIGQTTQRRLYCGCVWFLFFFICSSASERDWKGKKIFATK